MPGAKRRFVPGAEIAGPAFFHLHIIFILTILLIAKYNIARFERPVNPLFGSLKTAKISGRKPELAQGPGLGKQRSFARRSQPPEFGLYLQETRPEKPVKQPQTAVGARKTEF